jgi:prevent-host-death family protein
MKTTTVSKLKASLGEYLRSVKAGEEVLVTERGRPVARLSPAARCDVLADHLVEMEKHGLLRSNPENCRKALEASTTEESAWLLK